MARTAARITLGTLLVLALYGSYKLPLSAEHSLLWLRAPETNVLALITVVIVLSVAGVAVIFALSALVAVAFRDDRP